MMSNDKTKYSHPMPRQMPFEFVLTVNFFYHNSNATYFSYIYSIRALWTSFVYAGV